MQGNERDCIMQKLDITWYPRAGMNNLRWINHDGSVHEGRYGLTDDGTYRYRWIDNDGHEYVLNDIAEWESLDTNGYDAVVSSYRHHNIERMMAHIRYISDDKKRKLVEGL